MDISLGLSQEQNALLMKICYNCRTEKPMNEFYFQDATRSKRRRICKSCYLVSQRANVRTYGQRHREFRSRAGRTYYQCTRDKAVETLGGKCIRCGFADVRALQVDHVNGGGLQDLRDRGNRHGIYRAVIANEPGYQLLCANCNWIKKAENNEQPRRKYV